MLTMETVLQRCHCGLSQRDSWLLAGMTPHQAMRHNPTFARHHRLNVLVRKSCTIPHLCSKAAPVSAPGILCAEEHVVRGEPPVHQPCVVKVQQARCHLQATWCRHEQERDWAYHQPLFDTTTVALLGHRWQAESGKRVDRVRQGATQLDGHQQKRVAVVRLRATSVACTSRQQLCGTTAWSTMHQTCGHRIWQRTHLEGCGQARRHVRLRRHGLGRHVDVV